MGKRDRAAFERGHTPGEDATQLAAMILGDGTWERVDGHTPVDEVIEGESHLDLEPIEGGVVIIPQEDYKVMKEWMVYHGAMNDRDLPLVEWGKHKNASAGEMIVSTEEMDIIVRKARLHTFNALMRYVWQNSGNLWAAMRNLLAITHRNAPQFIQGMSGAEIGKFLGIGRAAFSAHSIKLVVEYLEKWGVKSGTLGGAKPPEHREKKRAQMMGRRHRAANYVSDSGDTPADRPKLSAEEKLRRRELLNQMAREAEQRRLAALCEFDPSEIDPSEIDLSKITPTEEDA